MSNDLKPIHDWQFNKIKASENLERFLVEVVANGDENKKNEMVSEAITKFGDYSKDVPLVDQITLDDIHGWLENSIHKSESRMSFFASKISSDEDYKSVEKALYEFGKKEGLKYTASSIEDAYKVQNDCILEGMPCDKINKVVSADENQLVWENTSDIHLDSILKGGSDPEKFHVLRRSYISGLFNGMGYTYSFSEPDGKRINTITK